MKRSVLAKIAQTKKQSVNNAEHADIDQVSTVFMIAAITAVNIFPQNVAGC